MSKNEREKRNFPGLYISNRELFFMHALEISFFPPSSGTF